MINDLVKWLDEDERLARACEGDDVSGWVAGDVEENGEPDVGKHIGRWLPSRVLAEVEAKRRILALHPKANDPGQPPYCETCKYIEDPNDPEPFPEAGYPCPTILALAATYGR